MQKVENSIRRVDPEETNLLWEDLQSNCFRVCKPTVTRVKRPVNALKTEIMEKNSRERIASRLKRIMA